LTTNDSSMCSHIFLATPMGIPRHMKSGGKYRFTVGSVGPTNMASRGALADMPDGYVISVAQADPPAAMMPPNTLVEEK